MPLTPQIRTTEGQSLLAATSDVDLRVTQTSVLSIINFPTLAMRTTQASLMLAASPNFETRVTQASVLFAARPRLDNRYVRDWGFSLDSHDFYVLNLGTNETLVYDAATGQWSEWDTKDLNFLRGNIGVNWLGMGKGNYDGTASTNVVVGDDNLGILWTLDPNQGFDDATDATLEPKNILRAVRGAIPVRGRDKRRNNAVYLTISSGAPSTENASVTLRTSDDQGRTWTDHGAILVEMDNWSQEISWRSLGVIKAPGRIFEFIDDGAAVRFDSVDADIGGEDD